MSRLQQSGKNIVSYFITNTASTVLNFVSRTVFIYSLGSAYLGLSGLLSNILGFLTISELGIATAIGFSLYKPLAEKDYRSISALMSLYRRAYQVIGCIVAILGVVLFFFIDFFIPPTQQPAGTQFAYFTFLFSTVLGYFLSYKTTLIGSDNQAYRLMPINVGLSSLQTVVQIVVLLITKNYVHYLLVHTLFSVCIMVMQNRYITRLYKDVDFHSTERITKEQATTIKRNIGGLIIAKIGDYLVNSTDNLIITKLVGLVSTGIYSNYLLIRNIVNGYIGVFFSQTTAAMGNVVAVETDTRKKEIFDAMMFCAFFVYSFEAVCFMCLFNPFIGDLWIGKEFLFSPVTVAVIVVNNYLTGLRIPLITMKSAAGKYLEDAWVPFAFAGINLVSSILLAKWIGVTGVFLGTILGSLLTADWYRPIVIYRHVFHASVKEYYKNYLLYFALGGIYIASAYWMCSYVRFENVILAFLVKSIIACALPIGCNILFFRHTKNFLMIQAMGQRVWSAIIGKLRCANIR